MLEVLHYRRSLHSSLGASVLDSHYHLALPYILYPPAQPLGLRPLDYRLGPYHYVLHPYTLRSCGIHPYVLHPRALYLLARSLAFNAHAPALALHTLGPSLGPQSYGLLPLASPLGPSLVLYPVVFRALVPDYFHLGVLKHLVEYYLSGLRPLNSSALVLQVHFDRHLSLYTRALREMTI